MQSQFTLDNYDCTIMRTTSGLYIEAKNRSMGTIFAKSVDQTTVKYVSKDNIFDIDTIYQLLDSLSNGNKSDNILLTISHKGVLTYKCKFNLGVLTKESIFTINLEEKKPDPSIRLERLIDELRLQHNELSITVHDIKSDVENISRASTSRLDKLEQEVKSIRTSTEVYRKANDERFDRLEKLLVDKLEQIENSIVKLERGFNTMKKASRSPTLQPDITIPLVRFTFDPEGKFASQFVLSNDNKTARAKTINLNSISASDPLPSLKKFRFTFLIESAMFIGVGIAPERALDKQKMCEDEQTFTYQFDGKIMRGQKSIGAAARKYGAGDKITFEVDREENTITLHVNNEHVYEDILPQDIIFYPYMRTSYYKVSGATFM